MKLQKSLSPVCIALQGFLAARALGGYTQLDSYISANPPYSTGGSTAGNGSTSAQYSGSLKTMDHVSDDQEIYQLPATWQDGTVIQSTGTLIVESFTWNPGCYSDGISMVYPPTTGFGQTDSKPSSGDGAWNHVY